MMQNLLISSVFLTPFSMGYNVFPTPANSNTDMSKFPPIDRLAPIDRSFMSLYDFKGVNASIPVNTPLANIGPANCSASDPRYGQEGTCTWSCGTCFRPDIDVVTCPSNLQWGLSFDDGLFSTAREPIPNNAYLLGPSPYTPELLKYLASKDVRATFFVVGSRVREYPAILLDIYKQGHQIGVHTWSHRALTTLSTEQIVAELQHTILAIEQVIGTRPTYMRPPFGDIDDRVRAIVKAMGLIPAMWDLDSNDILLSNNPNAFPNNELQDLFKTQAGKLSAGSQFSAGTITLQHDLYKAAAEAAPSMVDQILAAKVVPMPVSECNAGTTPYTNKALVIPPSRKYFQAPQPYVSNTTVTGSGKGNSASRQLLWPCFGITFVAGLFTFVF